MEMKLLKALIEAAGYKAYPYSGRGMLGRQCVGLTCSDVNTAIADLFEAVFEADVANEQEEYDARMSAHSALCDALRSSAQDSMGYDRVLYFKSVEWQDDNT
jgi:hypothetical protein